MFQDLLDENRGGRCQNKDNDKVWVHEKYRHIILGLAELLSMNAGISSMISSLFARLYVGIEDVGSCESHVLWNLFNEEHCHILASPTDPGHPASRSIIRLLWSTIAIFRNIP